MTEEIEVAVVVNLKFEKSGEYLKQSPWGLAGNTCYGTNG